MSEHREMREGSKLKSPIYEKYPYASDIVKGGLDELLSQGCSLNEAREMFLTEIDWRLRCSARVLVTAPSNDIGIGQLMAKELEQALNISVQVVPLEELGRVIDEVSSGTVVTSRYFIGKAEKIAAPKSVRVIPIDIYDYGQEFKLINNLSKGSYFGIVSLSSGLLKAAEVMIHSLRGNDVIVMTAQQEETHKVDAIVRIAKIIICDRFSNAKVKAAVQKNRADIIRPPQIICFENYIGTESINLLKRELGLV